MSFLIKQLQLYLSRVSKKRTRRVLYIMDMVPREGWPMRHVKVSPENDKANVSELLAAMKKKTWTAWTACSASSSSRTFDDVKSWCASAMSEPRGGHGHTKRHSMRVSVFIWSRFRWFSYLSWFCLIYLGDYNKPGQFIFASLCLSFHRAFFSTARRRRRHGALRRAAAGMFLNRPV